MQTDRFYCPNFDTLLSISSNFFPSWFLQKAIKAISDQRRVTYRGTSSKLDTLHTRMCKGYTVHTSVHTYFVLALTNGYQWWTSHTGFFNYWLGEVLETENREHVFTAQLNLNSSCSDYTTHPTSMKLCCSFAAGRVTIGDSPACSQHIGPHPIDTL